MTDHGRQDFERFTGPALASQDEENAAAPGHAPDNARLPIGVVLEISGSGSQIAFDLQRINDCMKDADPSIALAGQVVVQHLELACIQVDQATAHRLLTEHAVQETAGGFLVEVEPGFSMLHKMAEEMLPENLAGRTGAQSGVMVQFQEALDLRPVGRQEVTQSHRNA